MSEQQTKLEEKPSIQIKQISYYLSLLPFLYGISYLFVFGADPGGSLEAMLIAYACIILTPILLILRGIAGFVYKAIKGN